MSDYLNEIRILERPSKPRRKGLTCLVDHGPDKDGWMGLRGTEDFLDVAGDFVDFVKLPTTQVLLYPGNWVQKKIHLLKSYGIEVYTGGLLFEIAWLQKKTISLFKGLKEIGCPTIEISENFITLDAPERIQLIQEAIKQGLKVIYEYGRKYPKAMLHVDDIEREIKPVLEAGVDHVILERSEIDQFKDNPDILKNLVQKIGMENIILEVNPDDFPAYHVWLIKTLGSEVSLANVAPGQALKLEQFRRGMGRGVGYEFVAKGANV